MAYPVIAAPYGYKPVNLIGGQVFAGSTREYPIAYGNATNMFYGDPVTLTSGYITTITLPVNTTNTVVGIFLGCYYTSPQTKQRLYSQSYQGAVAAVAAGDITAIVCDDPDTVFKTSVVTTAGGVVIGSASSILVGQNMAGNTSTALPNGASLASGNGAGAVVAASTNTASAGFRVLGLVPDTQIETTGTANAAAAQSATTVVLNGLTAGQFIPVGTDLFSLINGQLQFACTVATAVASAATSAQSITTTAVVPAAGILSGATVVLVQSPEVLVKLNFGAHRYYVA
jgi:hypothetical protein